MDGGIRQADGQDSLRKLDGVLEAHQGDVCARALLPGVHRVGKRPGNPHLLGPRARILQLPGAQQHRELGWLVQSAGRKREGDGVRQEPLMARKGVGGVFGEDHAQEVPTEAKEPSGKEQGQSRGTQTEAAMAALAV